MRLGQLARKLSLRPTQLVEFLAKNNIQIEESSNARLEDNHVEIIVKHFAPENLKEIVDEVEETEEAVPTEGKQQVVEPVEGESESVENPDSREGEVIRVQKIELSGLKVVGKIDLPEHKKKEPAIEQTEEDSTIASPENLPVRPAEKPRGSNKKSETQSRDRYQQQKWKNPLELQRERETREAEEKKRFAAKREKEKRKQYYEERVKSAPQTKRVKPTKVEPEVKKKPVDTRPTPKTWLGKFLRWWTT